MACCIDLRFDIYISRRHTPSSRCKTFANIKHTMCKRPSADSVAQSCDCSFPANSRVVADLNGEMDSLYDGEAILGQMLKAAVSSNLAEQMDEIKPQICSLTNSLLPVFEMENICVCKLPDKQYCYLPEKIAELQAADEALERVPDWELCSALGITNEVEGTIILQASSCYALPCNSRLA